MFLRNPVFAIAFFLILVFSPSSQAQTPATVTHIVSVGRRGDDLALRFTPEETFAAIGDLIQFQFYPANHSAVSADFNRPCQPLDPSSERAFFSGFQPLPPNAQTLTSFTIPVTSLEPLFFYCAQERHCQQGFVGVVNP
ncbi:hypothetical protein DFH27DRAFT_477493 [Peziza echinospora]|nr:hypothetical protein DFH27DRAFT_477493 [Peziza echinospora]